jgi:hypothetical protein
MVQVGGNEPDQEIQATAKKKKVQANGKAWLPCSNVDAPGNALSWLAQANAQAMVERLYVL